MTKIKTRPISEEELFEHRRRWLVRALSVGAFATGGLLFPPAGTAGLFGNTPRELPKGQSIYDLDGDVEVNGKLAKPTTTIEPGDLVETGPGSGIVFAVGKDAFTLRENSKLQLSGKSGIVGALRVFTGALLSVFGRTRHRVVTSTATIGIRGTGLYVESEEDRSYVCTCYGVTKVVSSEDDASWEVVRSLGHDMPRYVLADASAGEAILGAPLKNHADIELRTLEALVGREVPYGFSFSRYRVRPREY